MGKIKLKSPNKLLLLKGKKIAAQQEQIKKAGPFQEAEESLEAGHLEVAAMLFGRLLVEYPDSPLIFARIGSVSHKLGRLDEADDYFRKALAAEAHNADALCGLGQLSAERGMFEVAARFFNQALKFAPDHYLALDCLGELWLRCGDLERARELFSRAVAVRPYFAEGLFHLGQVYANLGNLYEAETNYRLATIVKPDHAGAFNNWGIIQASQGRFDEAETSYRRSLEIDPDNFHALFNLAELYEKTSKLSEAEDLVKQALVMAPSDPGLSRLMATLLRRQGKLQEALAVLEKVTVPPDNPDKALEVHFELARIQDRLGQYEKAFRHFSQTKELQALSPLARKFDKNNFLQKLAGLEDCFNNELLARWPRDLATAEGGARPVFLVGFPRSGTTLLDQILDSHPDFQVVEETAALEMVISLIKGMEGGYPGGLERLSAGAVAELRQEYFRYLSRFAGNRTAGGRLVDKYPLHIMHLGLICRLFPEARIILAIRHPYDVCLSNFMQLFNLNDAMANFLNLPDSAACYDRVMALGLRYLEGLPLQVHRIRYEDLVEDFETTTKGLLFFLGAEWDEKVSRYYEHAQGRGMIATPSYHQVTEPIYQRSMFRFKNYTPGFVACHDLLRPYVAHFGYPEVDETAQAWENKV